MNKLEECINILHPIDTLLKMFQSDAVPCSDVYKAFLDLESKMSELIGVSAEKKTYLAKLVQKRFDFMYRDAHGVVYPSWILAIWEIK